MDAFVHLLTCAGRPAKIRYTPGVMYVPAAPTTQMAIAQSLPPDFLPASALCDEAMRCVLSCPGRLETIAEEGGGDGLITILQRRACRPHERGVAVRSGA